MRPPRAARAQTVSRFTVPTSSLASGDVLWHRSAAAWLLDVTLHDRQALLTIYRVDSMPQFTRVPFALPRVVSGRGAGAAVAPRLNNVERKSLQQSASLVRKAISPLQQVRGFE